MLLTTLQACAGRVPDPVPIAAAPPPVVVKVKDTPPSDLTACPDRPAGFPADAVAVMPAPVRNAVMRLARAFAANTARLERLIEWTAPGSCK